MKHFFQTKKLFVKSFLCIICIASLCLCLFGCGNPKKQINLTLWHVYGEQVDSPINSLIDEFNETIGAENGMSVSVTSVSNSNKIHDAVLEAANGDPAAPKLPDIFSTYPKTVSAMNNADVLVDYKDYFTDDELAQYVTAFISEGMFDDKLLIFPIAKSTEILYVNKTIFDRFAADTGAKLDDLSTWEGLYDTAVKYSKWSDAKTPDIPNDGKPFFAHDYPFHYFQVGVKSLGQDFFDGEKLSFSSEYKTAWDLLAKAAFSGGVWLGSAYATEALRTGDAIVSVASSASVLYYENIVTYDDNTSEDVDIISLPYPTFKNGKKLVMQRGSGFCVTKSDPEREKAACTFIKWLTSARNNARLAAMLGYIPVCKESYNGYLEKETAKLTDPKYKSLYKTIDKINPEFEFVYPPRFDSYLDTETKFIGTIHTLLEQGRDAYRENESEDTLLNLTDEYYNKFKEKMQTQ